MNYNSLTARFLHLHSKHRSRNAVSFVFTRSVFAMMILLSSCNGGEPLSDAYGNFEATEVLVSAEASGKLLAFTAEEGLRLSRNEVVGLIDTTQLALKRKQLTATRSTIRSRLTGVQRQIEVVETQLEIALKEKRRIEQLLQDQAATGKQLDDVSGQIQVFERQISALSSQNGTIFSEMAALDVQIEQVDDQLARSRIVNPVNGTVLTTHIEPGELAVQGRPLFKIADLETMYLRAYVTGAQLPGIRLGQEVTVLIDENATANQALTGTIIWISDQAEFTPKLIQTKEERVSLVYAIKIRVANAAGLIKIGMPGEVMFSSAS